MHTKTKQGLENILIAASKKLVRNGRPRKPLNKPRPYRKGNKLCTVAAIEEAAQQLGISPYKAKLAMAQAIESFRIDWPWWTAKALEHSGGDIKKALLALDNNEYDTRKCVRHLRRAAKMLQHG